MSSKLAILFLVHNSVSDFLMANVNALVVPNFFTLCGEEYNGATNKVKKKEDPGQSIDLFIEIGISTLFILTVYTYRKDKGGKKIKENKLQNFAHFHILCLGFCGKENEGEKI